MRSSLRRAWGLVAVHLLPSRCFVCEERLPAIQHLGSCGRCWTRLAPSVGPACGSCGLPVSRPAERCVRCALRPLPLDGVAAAFRYDEVARRFLLRAKSGGRRELLAPFGRQLAAAVRAAGVGRGVDAVASVPPGPWSRLRRGFDPAEEIARGVASELGLTFAHGCLKRRRGMPHPAKSLGAEARWRAAREAFSAARDVGGCVLLVDDVMTTGATASACARALRDAGAKSVRAAVWARTL